MAKVSESAVVGLPLAETWHLYFDQHRWPAWVDGFSSVLAASDGYPAAGSTLRWRSTPAGRGEVSETVLEHEPRSLHRISFSDPESEGELRTTFAIATGEEAAGGDTRVQLELAYKLRSGGLFARIADVLFVRSQMRRSLARSLERLRAEAADR